MLVKLDQAHELPTHTRMQGEMHVQCTFRAARLKKRRTGIQRSLAHGSKLGIGVRHKLVDRDDAAHTKVATVFDVPLQVAAPRFDQIYVLLLILVCQRLACNENLRYCLMLVTTLYLRAGKCSADARCTKLAHRRSA